MNALPANVPTATSKQIGAMHALKARLGLDDAAYRDVIEGLTGHRSAKALTRAQAAQVIDSLKDLSGQPKGHFKAPFASGLPDELPHGAGARRGAADGALQLDGAYAAKLRALWISGYDLGVFHNPSDAALLEFIARQTGIVHTRWLRDARDAAAVIEALKSWITREAGIVWPGREADPLDIKRAVVTAQWMRLVELGAVYLYIAAQPLSDLDRYAFQIAGKQGWQWFDGDDYAAVQSALGRKLRQALGRKGKAGRV